MICIEQVFSGSQVYWLTRLDGIGVLLTTLAIISAVAVGMTVLASFIAMDFVNIDLAYDHSRKMGEKKQAAWLATRKRAVRWVAAPLILGAASVFVPTTKEAAAILVLPAVANSQDVQAMSKDIVQLAREWIDEARPKARAKKGD